MNQSDEIITALVGHPVFGSLQQKLDEVDNLREEILALRSVMSDPARMSLTAILVLGELSLTVEPDLLALNIPLIAQQTVSLRLQSLCGLLQEIANITGHLAGALAKVHEEETSDRVLGALVKAEGEIEAGHQRTERKANEGQEPRDLPQGRLPDSQEGRS